jgi:hypothetical protein
MNGMNRTEEPFRAEGPFELEGRLHSLLCGSLSPAEREELLGLLVHDDQARRLLEEMLGFQRACRRAAGLDEAEERALQDLEALRARCADIREPAHAQPRDARGRRWGSAGLWARVAAAVVIASSIYAVWAIHQGGSSPRDLVRRPGEERPPSMGLTQEELERYREIWNQVAEGGGTWVLLKEGSGQFGSFSTGSAQGQAGTVLLVQCRVVNSQGQLVYSADVLLPDEPALKVRLPEAGQLGGQRATLAVSAGPGGATVGLTVQNSSLVPVGVTGQAPLGDGREVGRFRLHEQDMRFFVRTQRLSGFQT